MKILHVGLTVNGRGEGLSKAFKKASSEYFELPVSPNLKGALASVPFQPDIIFLQIQSGEIGGAPTVEILREYLASKDCYKLNWTGDMRSTTPVWMRQLSPFVSETGFTNYRDVESLGSSGIFLQIGIDPEVFKIHDEKEAGEDVVFMGNNYGNQFPNGQFRRDLARWLIARGYGVYGSYQGSKGALNPDPRNPFPVQSRESKIYNNSKIAISVSHYKEKGYTSDRLLRAMGSGCFTLAQYYPGIEDDFKIGEHLDTFSTIYDLEEKINTYLSANDLRNKIAKAGYEYVHSNFTYDNMVERIIKQYESWKREH
jgi:hypothetical protein